MQDYSAGMDIKTHISIYMRSLVWGLLWLYLLKPQTLLFGKTSHPCIAPFFYTQRWMRDFTRSFSIFQILSLSPSLHSVLVVTDMLTSTSHSPTPWPFWLLPPWSSGSSFHLLPHPTPQALLSTENQTIEPPLFPQAAGKTFSFISSLVDLPPHSPPRCSDPFSFTSFQLDSPYLILRMWSHGLISQKDEGIQDKPLQFCSSLNPHLPFLVTWWIWQNQRIHLHILSHFPSSSGALFHKLFPPLSIFISPLQHVLFT